LRGGGNSEFDRSVTAAGIEVEGQVARIGRTGTARLHIDDAVHHAEVDHPLLELDIDISDPARAGLIVGAEIGGHAVDESADSTVSDFKPAGSGEDGI
jgi:hypothetical protein